MRVPFTRSRKPDDAKAFSLANVLAAIDRAVLAPAAWPRALAAMGRYLESDAALLALGGHGAGSARLVASWGLRDAAVSSCEGAAIPADALVREALGGHAGELLPGGEWFSTSELGRVAGADTGLAHAAGALLNRRDPFAFLWLMRTARQRPFRAADGERADIVICHLGHAAVLQARLQRAERHLDLLTATFDHIALGAVIVDPEGRPLMVNRVAGRIAAANEGFGISSEGIFGAGVAETRKLAELIRTAAAGGQEAGSVGMCLPRRGEGRPFEVIVVPLAGERLPEGAAAVAFVSDPERHHLTPEGLLRDLYTLTSAEARLALLLAGGASLNEAADALGITRNTAHTHLDSVFTKTGTHSQIELVRMLHRGPVATRPYEDSARHQRVSEE